MELALVVAAIAAYVVIAAALERMRPTPAPVDGEVKRRPTPRELYGVNPMTLRAVHLPRTPRLG